MQRIDVIAKQGNTFEQINSIYLEKSGSGKNDEMKKLYWKAGKNFQIIQKDSTGKQSVIKVVWNFWD